MEVLPTTNAERVGSADNHHVCLRLVVPKGATLKRIERCLQATGRGINLHE